MGKKGPHQPAVEVAIGILAKHRLVGNGGAEDDPADALYATARIELERVRKLTADGRLTQEQKEEMAGANQLALLMGFNPKSEEQLSVVDYALFVKRNELAQKTSDILSKLTSADGRKLPQPEQDELQRSLSTNRRELALTELTAAMALASNPGASASEAQKQRQTAIAAAASSDDLWEDE